VDGESTFLATLAIIPKAGAIIAAPYAPTLMRINITFDASLPASSNPDNPSSNAMTAYKPHANSLSLLAFVSYLTAKQ
jgi:hypothetical protein